MNTVGELLTSNQFLVVTWMSPLGFPFSSGLLDNCLLYQQVAN